MSVFNNHRPLHGVTPLYFLQMESFNRQLFLDLIRETPAELSLPFINSILEIRDVIKVRYYDENWEGLTDEELAALTDIDVMKYLVPLYQGHFVEACKELEIIREEQSMNFAINDVNNNLIIAKLPFNTLIKEPYDSISRILDSAISDIAATRDLQGNLINLGHHINLHQELLSNLNVAIGLLEERIVNIHNSAKARNKSSLGSKFQSIVNEIELIDNFFEGIQNGYRDKERTIMINNMLSKLDFLGFNTLRPLTDQAKRLQSSVSAMSGKMYNQQLIPKLENIKRIFERARISVITNIDTLKGNNLNYWYF